MKERADLDKQLAAAGTTLEEDLSARAALVAELPRDR